MCKADRLLRLLSMESTAFASGMGQYCSTACSITSLFDSAAHSIVIPSVDGHTLGQNFRVHIQIEQTRDLQEENHDDLLRHGHISAMDLRVRDLNVQIEKIKADQKNFIARFPLFLKNTIRKIYTKHVAIRLDSNLCFVRVVTPVFPGVICSPRAIV